MRKESLIVVGLLGATLTFTFFWDSAVDLAKSAATKGVQVMSLEETVQRERLKLSHTSRLRDEIYGLVGPSNKENFEKWLRQTAKMPDNYDTAVLRIAAGIANAPRVSMPKIQELVNRYSIYNPNLKHDIERKLYQSALEHTSNKSYSQSERSTDVAVDFAGLSDEGIKNIGIIVDIMYNQAKSSAEMGFYRDASTSLNFARDRARFIGTDAGRYEIEVIEAAFKRVKLSAEWGSFEHAKKGVKFIEDAARYLQIDTTKYREGIANAVHSTIVKYIGWKSFADAEKGIDYGKYLSASLGSNWNDRFSALELRIPSIRK